jgi:hypothetical protein
MKFSDILLPVSLIILVAVAGCTGSSAPVPATTPPPSPIPTIIPATPAPDPYPHTLSLGQEFPFGSANVASEGTVYRYWMNDTYQWLDNMDNHYYTKTPTEGNKYLFIFVRMANNGTTRVWYPPASSIAIDYNGVTYLPDPDHFIPDTASDPKTKPIKIREVEYFSKLNGDEYVEDFGFSDGSATTFLYPGTSNALDGYIIYTVPVSLTPNVTYVKIPFNGQDLGIWKLA